MAIKRKTYVVAESKPRNTTEHDRLVQVARKWLSGTGKCRFVLTEMRAASVYEQPDAIGWKGRGESIVIEVKTSRADFRADRLKTHARAQTRLGQRRYYLTPKGLLKTVDLPVGWGLLEQHGDRVRKIGEAEPFPEDRRDTTGELCLLLAAAQGVSATITRNAFEARAALEEQD